MVLMLMLFTRICYCVNKNSIGYAYGYKGIGDQANSEIFEITTAFPMLS
jgi:hypothetical protein